MYSFFKLEKRHSTESSQMKATMPRMFFSWVFLRDRPEFCHLRRLVFSYFLSASLIQDGTELEKSTKFQSIDNKHPSCLLQHAASHTKSKRSHNGWSSSLLQQWSSLSWSRLMNLHTYMGEKNVDKSWLFTKTSREEPNRT